MEVNASKWAALCHVTQRFINKTATQTLLRVHALVVVSCLPKKIIDSDFSDKTINELIVYRFVVSSFKIHLEREQDRLAMTRPAAALLIAIGVSTSILQRGESEISCAKKAIFKVSLNKGVF